MNINEMDGFLNNSINQFNSIRHTNPTEIITISGVYKWLGFENILILFMFLVYLAFYIEDKKKTERKLIKMIQTYETITKIKSVIK